MLPLGHHDKKQHIKRARNKNFQISCHMVQTLCWISLS